jgi:N-acetylmuramoyl-L-alanine amidase
MIRPLVLLILAAVGTIGEAPRAREAAPPTAQTLYEEAFALEHVLRSDLDAADASPALAKRLREIITAYEAVVRRYPRSGYCDNALWQAAGLAREGAERWNQERDRLAERRLLQWLVSEYPYSPFVASARKRMADASSPPARTQPATAVLRSVSRAVLPDVVRVTIELDREVPYTTDRLDTPPRAFFDFSPSGLSAGVFQGTQRFSNDVVRQIRIGVQPQQTTRVVIDLEGVKGYSTYQMYNPYRLVVDCERSVPHQNAAPADASPPAAPSRSAAEAPRASGRPPAPQPPLMAASWGPMFLAPPVAVPGGAIPPDATDITAPEPQRAISAPVAASPAPATSTAAPAPAVPSAAKPETPASPPARTTEQPAPPASNLGGGYSLARQLGLGVSRIVIDPGHGGHDPGAQASGRSESAIVLDVALRLEKLLVQAGGNDVVLTRRTDTYVSLEERTAIANRAQADLFLSIHVNAHRNRAVGGVETYFLNFANTPDAASVAARENASAGMNMGSLPDVVKAIALNSKSNESRDFAEMVQQAMVKRLSAANRNVKNLGVKQAPFVVLIGAAMPSVLVEISFITNAQEARLLRDATYRQRIAAALADAIQRYQRTLKASRPTEPQ